MACGKQLPVSYLGICWLANRIVCRVIHGGLHSSYRSVYPPIAGGGKSPILSSLPFLPFLFPPSPFPFSPFPLPSHFPESPLVAARGPGERSSSPRGFGRSPAAKRILMYLRSKLTHWVKLQPLIIQVAFLWLTCANGRSFTLDYTYKYLQLQCTINNYITHSVQSGCRPPRQQNSRMNEQWAQHKGLRYCNTSSARLIIVKTRKCGN